jgi:methionyl-tRNA formyltransferase
LSIAQPEKLREEAFLNTLRAWNADVFVVVAFRMLPDVVWKMPRLGTFNLHASLLPDYRGAAPINWAVMNGDLETGVSTFFIDEKIDTGNVILQRTMSIGANETAGELHDRMIVTGSGLVVETLDLIQSGKVNPVAQSKFTNVQQRAAPKLFKENTRIDWKRGAKAIHDHIRGLSPYPSAWTLLKNSKGQEKQFKFFRSEIIEGLSSPEIKLWSDKEFIYISYPESTLKILSLQMEGKKQMSSKEWLAGNSISDWHLIL